MISQRNGVIAELRDEEYTLWTSGWLAFRLKAAKAFPGLDFNLQVPDEEEVEESVSKDKVDPEVFSDTPSLVALPGEAEIPTEAGSASLSAWASPSDSRDFEAYTTEVARSSTPQHLGPIV